MLANLMPPPAATAISAFDIVLPGTPRRGTLAIHPRYRQWLARLGLNTMEKLLNLQGEIVSGHADRHVRCVRLGGRTVYLKREHCVRRSVRRRNRAEGFGPVSRCEREVVTLRELESHGLPAPHWIAFGTLDGRAFLLVDDLANSVALPEAMESGEVSARAISKAITTLVGDVHAAGFTTPDLAAKHVFINTDTAAATLIDWQSAKKVKSVTLEERVRAWAQLHASLPVTLASPRRRIFVLHRYWKRFCLELPSFSEFLQMVESAAARLQARSSIRVQHAIRNRENLVWLADDEAVCVIASVAPHWPEDTACRPYYPKAEEYVPNGAPLVMTAPDGAPATLRRWRSSSPFILLKSQLWRSPAARRARYLFDCEREGRPAPALVAFGQRRSGWCTVESFVLERQ
jgi:hypothetical protein